MKTWAFYSCCATMLCRRCMFIFCTHCNIRNLATTSFVMWPLQIYSMSVCLTQKINISFCTSRYCSGLAMVTTWNHSNGDGPICRESSNNSGFFVSSGVNFRSFSASVSKGNCRTHRCSHRKHGLECTWTIECMWLSVFLK